jgi:hypothetical protein
LAEASATDSQAAPTAAAAAAGSAGVAPTGAVMYREKRSIVLQPSSSCGYQFMVTRNPSLLQPDPHLAAQAGPRQGRAHSKMSRSWWVSAGALSQQVAGVLAVLALAVCCMSAQSWSGYKVSLEAILEAHQTWVLPNVRTFELCVQGGCHSGCDCVTVVGVSPCPLPILPPPPPRPPPKPQQHSKSHLQVKVCTPRVQHLPRVVGASILYGQTCQQATGCVVAVSCARMLACAA